MIASVLAYATTGPHRARAQSAVADGARNRNRTLRVHGINATCVTVHKPPFPNSRIMLLISISLSITKFPPEQRVDQDGILQSALDRAREAPHRLPGTDLDPRCGASKASTVWRQVATAVWRQVATAVWRQEASAEEPRCRNGCQHASSWENQGSNL